MNFIETANVKFQFHMQVFRDVAYKARNREDLIAGVDEFLDKVSE